MEVGTHYVKNYAKCFLFHLKCSFVSSSIPVSEIVLFFVQNIMPYVESWKWNNYDIIKWLT